MKLTVADRGRGVRPKVTDKQCTVIRADADCNSICWIDMTKVEGSRPVVCSLFLKFISIAVNPTSFSCGFLNDQQHLTALCALSLSSWNLPPSKLRVRLRLLFQMSFVLHGSFAIYRGIEWFVWSCSQVVCEKCLATADDTTAQGYYFKVNIYI